MAHPPRKAKIMSTKINPGAFDCLAKAEDDEPLFILLARDPIAPAMVRLWADAAAASAKTEKDSAKAENAALIADKMEVWAAERE